jgi:hypothetical protein
MAAKLKDGVFLGDYECAQDLEFVLANKITHIICCAGREVRAAFAFAPPWTLRDPRIRITPLLYSRSTPRRSPTAGSAPA